MHEYDEGEFCRQAAFGAGGTGRVYADGGGMHLTKQQNILINDLYMRVNVNHQFVSIKQHQCTSNLVRQRDSCQAASKTGRRVFMASEIVRQHTPAPRACNGNSSTAALRQKW